MSVLCCNFDSIPLIIKTIELNISRIQHSIGILIYIECNIFIQLFQSQIVVELFLAIVNACLLFC